MGRQPVDVQVGLGLLRRQPQDTRRAAGVGQPADARRSRSCPTKDSTGRKNGRSTSKCVDGTDAGTEVVFKTTTDGGNKAIVVMVERVRDRLNGGQHDGKVVPIVLLENDSYPHSQYGRVWIPVLTIVDWMSLDGPAPAPTPAAAARRAAAAAGASPKPRRA